LEENIMNVLLLVLGLAAALALGAAAGYFYCKSRASARQAEARNDAQSIIEDARREAETTRRGHQTLLEIVPGELVQTTEEVEAIVCA